MTIMKSAGRSILFHGVWEIHLGVELLGSMVCICSHLVVTGKYVSEVVVTTYYPFS